MATIDVSKIEGFEALSAEDKVNVLLGYEIPEANNNEEITRLKSALSKSNSEAADWKRQYREKLTEQERADAERAEAEKALKEELEQYRRDKTVMGYKDQYRSIGYSDELAQATAVAMANGDTASVFENQRKFLDEQIKAINAAVLSQQPKLTGGETPSPDKIEEGEIARLRRYAGL